MVNPLPPPAATPLTSVTWTQPDGMTLTVSFRLRPEQQAAVDALVADLAAHVSGTTAEVLVEVLVDHDSRAGTRTSGIHHWTVVFPDGTEELLRRLSEMRKEPVI